MKNFYFNILYFPIKGNSLVNPFNVFTTPKPDKNIQAQYNKYDITLTHPGVDNVATKLSTVNIAFNIPLITKTIAQHIVTNNP